jgi:predicted Zn-dependent peptidase
VDHQLTTLPSGVTRRDRVDAVRCARSRSARGSGSARVTSTTAQSGCSHFLEHLLFKGTTRRSARDIAEALDAVGGEMNAFTTKELTCFYARVLDRDLPLAMDVLADMMVAARNATRRPWTPSGRSCARSSTSTSTQPDDLVHSDFCGGRARRDHPLAYETLGTVASVVALDRDTIHGYYLDRYRPGDVSVVARPATSTTTSSSR